METFSALLTRCEGKPAVAGGFLSQKQVIRSFDVFVDVHLKKKTIEQTVEMEVIWEARKLIVTSLWCVPRRLSAMMNLINRNGFAYVGEKRSISPTEKKSNIIISSNERQ